MLEKLAFHGKYPDFVLHINCVLQEGDTASMLISILRGMYFTISVCSHPLLSSVGLGSFGILIASHTHLYVVLSAPLASTNEPIS